MQEDLERFPVISVVGKSDSGKTTVIEKLVAALCSRGYRVSTIKHHTHASEIDVPGKDSWRHSSAGASEVVLAGRDKIGHFRAIEEPARLETLLGMVDRADIVITEGFNDEGRVLVEVCRRARSRELVNPPSRLFAVVTDNELDSKGKPMFRLDEAEPLADLIESTFLSHVAPGREGGELA